MPCYSIIQTKLITFTIIQQAVKEIGAKIIAQSPNNIVIEKGDKRIALERSREGENYRLMTSRSSIDYEELLDSLTVSYAKNTLKAWAKKSGYTFSAGSKPGEYVMTQYQGG
jgi:hypothetical protein